MCIISKDDPFDGCLPDVEAVLDWIEIGRVRWKKMKPMAFRIEDRLEEYLLVK